MITIEVRLFGPMREAVGPRIDVEVAPPATAASITTALAEQQPEIAPLLARSRVAVDGVLADGDAAVDARSEVAIIPPVGGG